MTLDDALSGVDAIRPEIEAYRTKAINIKTGAENESRYNPSAPSSSPLTEQVKTAGQCVAKADAALKAIDGIHKAFAELAATGYDQIPMTIVTAEAMTDLTTDKAQIDLALAHMQVEGATAIVAEEISDEEPIGR
jgi:hypothetical protein